MFGCESWTVKESWVPKNRCFWTVVLEKTLENPLDCKEIQAVHRKGNQSWIFIGRTDAEVETPVLWPPDVKNWLTGKDPDAGKDWRWEEERTTEDEMVGWHHWLSRHEFEQALWMGDGQRGLACCGSWGHKESDTTERLNWTESVSWWRAKWHAFSALYNNQHQALAWLLTVFLFNYKHPSFSERRQRCCLVLWGTGHAILKFLQK